WRLALAPHHRQKCFLFFTCIDKLVVHHLRSNRCRRQDDEEFLAFIDCRGDCLDPVISNADILLIDPDFRAGVAKTLNQFLREFFVLAGVADEDSASASARHIRHDNLLMATVASSIDSTTAAQPESAGMSTLMAMLQPVVPRQPFASVAAMV